MIIGSKIKELRKKNNLTQKDLADLLNLSVSTIQKYELEQREPTIETVQKLSKILNVSFIDLVPSEDLQLANEYLRLKVMAQERGIISPYDNINESIRGLFSSLGFNQINNYTEDELINILNSIEFKILIDLLLSKYPPLNKEGE